MVRITAKRMPKMYPGDRDNYWGIYIGACEPRFMACGVWKHRDRQGQYYISDRFTAKMYRTLAEAKDHVRQLHEQNYFRLDLTAWDNTTDRTGSAVKYTGPWRRRKI